MSSRKSPAHALTFGTRTSRLARWQTAHVVRLLKEAWPEISCRIIPFETRGDRVIDKPLPEIGGKGLFTAELEQALRNGEIDLAVHSLKDLPVDDSPGLTIGAMPARASVQDGLVARKSHTLETLPPGSIVGTSSLRRQAQLLAVRPDLQVKSIRGNVGTRVRKALEEDYDATILATAGLERIDMEDAVSDWLALDVMLPAPGQGALAVQCRADDADTLRLLEAIDNAATRAATTAERQFLQALGGGCSAPIAAYANPNGDDSLEMCALIAAPDGGQVIRVQGQGRDPYELGKRLAEQALQQGATAILDEVAQKSSLAPQPQPLLGLRVVVTRAREQASELADSLAALGAKPVLFPAIRIAPVADTEELDDAVQGLAQYDWVVFTSVNGVAIFWERLEALERDVSVFDGVRVAAIGPATGQALKDNGIGPDFVPDEFVAERIAEGLGAVSGKSILLPRAELARATLADMLAEQGADVTEIAAYRTLPADVTDEELAQLDDVDLVTFTSSSTVRNFVQLVGGPQETRRLINNALIACIGPITAGTATELDMPADIVAETYTMDGLVRAIVDHYKKGDHVG